VRWISIAASRPSRRNSGRPVLRSIRGVPRVNQPRN